MNMIIENQNSPELIKLLKASTVAYKKAKYWEIRITFLVIVLAFLYPPVYVFSKNENFKLILFGCSFFLAVFIQVFYNSFKGNTSRGALFKEEFDTSLFGLPWKSTLSKSDHAEVSKLSLEYKGPEIRDWYSTNLSQNIPNDIIIAVCQHSNTSWDISLRKTYRDWLRVFLFLYSVGLFAFLAVEKVDGMTIFGIGFSVLSFYTDFIALIRGHSSVIEKREKISNHLDDIIRNKQNITTLELRDIQDDIYTTRQEAAKVPNFFFQWYRKKMNAESEDYIQSVNSIYNSK